MLEIDAATETLMVPIWAAGAISAALLAAIILAIDRGRAAPTINVLLRAGIVAIAICAGWFYMQRVEQQEHATERRSLTERSAALLAGAVAPGSALSCLDELAGQTVEVACEKAVFASPESIAAAVTYVAAKLALLADGDDYARRIDATFAAELAPLRTALALDRFGIVAHVLAGRYGCTADKCDVLTRFGDQSHLLANLRDATFDEQVAKYAANWNGPQHAVPDGGTAVTSAAALPTISPAPVTVSPRYDFPSSQSIPPVNIMVPEAPAPRVATAPGGQQTTPPGEGNSRAATTPVPPRRPPQARTSLPARPPSPPQPAAPTAVGEAPQSDAGAPQRPSAPAESR